MGIVICRARLGHNCDHGRPVKSVYPPGESMRDDGTWNGSSVICNRCYIRLLPYTPDGMGMRDDLPAAIGLYRDAHRPLEERVETFMRVNEAEEGVKVLREDMPDGSVRLHVQEHGAPEALAWLIPGKPIRWL